jgi:hypothetical protein
MDIKSGIRGIQREIEDAVTSTTSVDGSHDVSQPYGEPEEREEATAPKFEPPPSP